MNPQWNGLFELLIMTPLPAYFLVDSMMSWKQLAQSATPMNLWYLTFSATFLGFILLMIILKTWGRNLNKYILTFLSMIQYLVGIFGFVWLNIGYVWLTDAWNPAEGIAALNFRFKILFFGIMSCMTILYLPIVIFPIFLVIRGLFWVKGYYKRIQMKKKLQGLYDKIYDAKYNFHKLLPTLTMDFFKLPIQPQELNILEKNFSEKLSENKPDEDLCPICFGGFAKDETVTKVPVCGHDFHFDCLKEWIEKNHNCPVCRGFVRTYMIQHYHGEFEMPKEADPKADAQAEDNQAQGGVELNATNMTAHVDVNNLGVNNLNQNLRVEQQI